MHSIAATEFEKDSHPAFQFRLAGGNADFRPHELVFKKDSARLQILNRDVFDKLMKSDYYDAGGEKYVRSEAATREDLQASAGEIERRVQALVGEGQAGRRSLPGGGTETPSSPQSQESVNDAAQDLTQHPADYQSQKNQTTPNISGNPQAEFKKERVPGSLKAGETANSEGKTRAAESWQLRQKDFLELKGKALDDPAARLEHETSVELALAEGKSVPPEVVKDYPHVAEEYKTAFVRTKDNKVNLGEISEDISKDIGMPAAPIRMQYGHYGYGGIHIDVARKGTRLERIKAAGYSDSIEFVQDIAGHYNEIWKQPNGKLLLVKRNGDAKVSIVKLIPSERGHYYGVTSAYIAKAEYPASEGRKLLWKRQND